MDRDSKTQLDQIKSLCSGLPEWALNYIMGYAQALIKKARADQKAGADDEA